MVFLPYSAHSREKACALLAQGQVVAIPTETVYGLAADATLEEGVARIYATKERPQFNPLIVHCYSLDQAVHYGIFTQEALRLAEAFWPGPLTLVVKRRPPTPERRSISLLASAGLDTVALRVPQHPVALDLLKTYGFPIAAPSANPYQGLSPTQAQHVEASLGDKIPLILEGGNCGVGVESTILDLSEEVPQILRAGAITPIHLEPFLGREVGLYEGTKILAPGMVSRHYAPKNPLRLNVSTPLEHEVFLGFGPVTCFLNLSPQGDLQEAAANLFSYLHQLDAQQKPIAVSPIPNEGIGLAINDRLRRASHPSLSFFPEV